MGGYSKIQDNTTTTNTTTNIDNSNPKSATDPSSDTNKAPDQPTQQEAMKEQEQHEEKESTLKKIPSLEEEDEEDGKGKLRRNFSTASRRFMRLEGQNSSSIVSSKALQGALRRAFSVRSSASEKYSRIYSNGPVALASPFEEDDHDDEEDGSAKARSGSKDVKEKKHKAARILRGCKRIFGL